MQVCAPFLLELWLRGVVSLSRYLSFSLSLLIFSRQALDFGPDEDGSSLGLHKIEVVMLSERIKKILIRCYVGIGSYNIGKHKN